MLKLTFVRDRTTSQASPTTSGAGPIQPSSRAGTPRRSSSSGAPASRSATTRPPFANASWTSVEETTRVTSDTRPAFQRSMTSYAALR